MTQGRTKDRNEKWNLKWANIKEQCVAWLHSRLSLRKQEQISCKSWFKIGTPKNGMVRVLLVDPQKIPQNVLSNTVTKDLLPVA